jgi:hypothetical protein
VKGITGESFVPESLILPQDILGSVMIQGCDRRCWPRCRTSMGAAWRFVRPAVGTPTVGSGSPMRRLEAPSLPAWLPTPSPWPPAPWTRATGLQVVPSPQVAPRGRRKRGDTDCAAPTGHLFRTPRSVRGLLGGPRRPTPRPRAQRGASVLRHHHHRVHNHHHHRSRRRHHHLGVISPRGTTSSSSNNSCSNNNSSGRPASRVAGRSRAPSECSPFFALAYLLC